LRAVHVVPRSSKRPMAPGAMSSSAVPISPKQGVDVRRSVAGAQSTHQRAAEQQQRADGENREQEHLEPERSGNAHQMQAGNEQRRNAEEDDIKASGRGDLERDERQAENEPVPPGHK
jgi:hypothetical protein